MRTWLVGRVLQSPSGLVGGPENRRWRNRAEKGLPSQWPCLWHGGWRVMWFYEDHRTPEQSGLEGTLETHPVPTPAVGRDIFLWIRMLEAPSNWSLNAPSGASTTSLGNLSQRLIALNVKSVLFIPNLNPH